MKTFKDLGIKPPEQAFIGDKIRINKILNKAIIVHRYKIELSKYNGDCLYLQISIGEKKHVVFTSSANLIAMIKQVPENDGFPFETTIIDDNDRFIFT